jgi:hypothetical protein
MELISISILLLCCAVHSCCCCKSGITQELYGWRIASVKAAEVAQSVPAMKRVVSSWFKTLEGSSGEQ